MTRSKFQVMAVHDISCSKRRLLVATLLLMVVSSICTITISALLWSDPKCIFYLSNNIEAERVRQWHEDCPVTGGGPRGVVVTAVAGGRLGNLVFEYLSVWAVAKRYNLWPAIPNLTLQTLNEEAFTSLKIPSLEDFTKRCNISYLLQDMINIGDAGNLKNISKIMEFENNKRVSIVVLKCFAIENKYLVPYWLELSDQIMFQNQYLVSSQVQLKKLTEDWKKQIKNNVASTPTDVQYVAVHVRRTDYHQFLIRKYGIGTKPATSDFFIHAMNEMRRRLQPLKAIFVVVSDDPEWCRQNLQAADVMIAGNSNITSPTEDLALLSACNHTILIYGTFGLTAAVHNKNGITITYHLKSANNRTTLAMDFAKDLANWVIL